MSVATTRDGVEPEAGVARALAGATAAAVEPTLVVDASGTVVYANRAAEQQFDPLRRGLVGTSAWQLVDPARRAEAEALLARVLAHGEPEEVVGPAPRGSSWVECRVTPVDGCLVVRVRTVTARVRREARERLEEVLAAVNLDAGDLSDLMRRLIPRLREAANVVAAEGWVATADGEWRHIVGDARAATPFEVFLRTSEGLRYGLDEGLAAVAADIGGPRVHALPAVGLLHHRAAAASVAGLTSVYTLPIIEHRRPVAVLALFHTASLEDHPWCAALSALSGRLHEILTRHREARLLDACLQETPVGMVIADVDGYLRRVNPWLCEALGFSAPQVLRRRLLDLVHPDDRGATASALESLARSEASCVFSHRMRHADGSWRRLEWRAVRVSRDGLIYATVQHLGVEGQDTVVAGLHRVVMDSTLQGIGARATLARLAQASAEALDGVRVAIAPGRGSVEHAGTAKVDGWSAEAYARSGTASATVTGRPDVERAPASDEQVVLLEVARLGCYVVEHERVFEERDRLLTTIEHMHDGVLITDAEPIDAPEGPRIVYVNRAFERTTGYTRDEVLGATPRILQGTMTDRATLDRIRTALERWEPIQVELANVAKDGQPLWFELSIAPVADAMGWYTHWVSIQRNITERKLLEGQLREAQKMEAVGRLAGGIAHDFNNMLTAIKGFAELLTLDLAEGELGGHVREISRAADRSADLVRKLLAFSRRQVLQVRTVDLSDLAREMEPLLRHLVGEAVTLSLHPSGTPLPVTVDPGQVGQVLLNLVVNAHQAMPAGGHLSVATSLRVVDETHQARHSALEPGVFAVLEVTDTGIGIPPDMLDKIFEPFFTTRTAEGGTGLGLSTVFGIVKQSGAQITVESEPGHGTTMTVYFPVTTEVSRAATHPNTPQPGVRPAAATVLVVEDEPLVRSSIERMLGREGLTVLAVGDGPDAERVARDHPGPIDLLLTDVVLPHQNGKRVAELVSKHRPGIPVVFMSGYAEDAIVHQGVLIEGICFLEKPFTRDELLERVGSMLGHA